MSLVALSLTSERMSGVRGRRGQPARTVAVGGDEPDLMLALCGEGASVTLGRRALAQRRLAPHRVVIDFLAQLGTDAQWQLARKTITPAEALQRVFQAVHPWLRGDQGVILILPSYLRREQMEAAGRAALACGMPILGAVPRCLAAALAAFTDHPWHNLGILVDVDEHALVCSVLRPNESDMLVLGQKALPELSLRVWKEKLLAALADRCVALCRHDPRETPASDQSAYDQLEGLLDASGQSRSVAIRIQGENWFQAFTMKPAEAVAAGSALARLAGREVRAALRLADQHVTSASIFLTAEAARLPGLVAEIYRRGENRIPVSVLTAQALAVAGLELGQRIFAGELSPGLFVPSAPLPAAETAELAEVLPFPARLNTAVNELP